MVTSLHRIIGSAVTLLVAVMLVTTTVNAQSVNYSDIWSSYTTSGKSINLTDWWHEDASSANTISSATPPVQPVNQTIFDEKLKSIKEARSGKTTNPLQTDVTWSKGFATTPQNYEDLSYWVTDNIIGYWGNSVAAKGSSDTMANAIDYWQNDGNLWYYNNIGEASISGTNCNNLYFADGQMSAQTIQGLSSTSGLTLCDIYIDSCYSYNNPMKTGFTCHNPNFYIGGTVALNQVQSMCTCGQFWEYFMENGGGGNPTDDLENACDELTEPFSNYGITYNGYW